LNFPASATALLTEPQRKHRHIVSYQKLWEKFLTIRAVLAPLLFSNAGGICQEHQNKITFAVQFKMDQMQAYASFIHQPIVLPYLKVNMPWINHMINFFVGYSIGHEYLQGRFWDHYDAYDHEEKPEQLWDIKLATAIPSALGRVWKGTYAYLDYLDFNNIRHQSSTADTNILHDKNIDSKYPIQTLKLWVPVHQNEVPTTTTFQPRFDDILKTGAIFEGTTDPTTRKALDQAEMSTYGYEGIGYDEENFYATGRITPLPPQSGIPGFQRITMMKYFHDSTGNVDWSALWAYEGVILPGGKIIVGRWWSPEHRGHTVNQYSGPFILWNVDLSWDKDNLNVSNH
jgi:hypothetical protein